MKNIPIWLILLSLLVSSCGSGLTGLNEEKYRSFLLYDAADYEDLPELKQVYADLAESFNNALETAWNLDLQANRGIPVHFDRKVFAETRVDQAEIERQQELQQISDLMRSTLPYLAYAYHVPPPPGQDPLYYRQAEVAELYVNVLEYLYSRGIDEQAWMVRMAGYDYKSLSRETGLERPSGDLSTQVLQLGGFIQSMFLMKEELEHRGLLEKYAGVVRNMVFNNMKLHNAVYAYRSLLGNGQPLLEPVPSEQERYYLNADGIRLLIDYAVPYYFMEKDPEIREIVLTVLKHAIDRNIKAQPGTQDTMKPDGTGFHHNVAYIGAYAPGALEVMAQCSYLFAEAGFLGKRNIEDLKYSLQAFRMMAHRYDVTNSLRGRLIYSGSTAPALIRAMALMAHSDGVNDMEMKARLAEWWDREFFASSGGLREFHTGRRGIPVRCLGIYRILSDLEGEHIPAASAPEGSWIKPFANAAFHRHGNWMAVSKGFSQYFWDFEGPLKKQQNSFGQNVSYGTLEIFSHGNPVSRVGSGYDIDHGWDWYHIPGTTASHYPIERRSDRAVRERRIRLGIHRGDVHRSYNSRTFVGGASLDQQHSVFVTDLEAVPFTDSTDLTARKTMFMIGDMVLAMGTDIEGGTYYHETHTTLFQTRLAEPDASMLNGTEVRGTIQRKLSGPQLLIDGVGNAYVFLDSEAGLNIYHGSQRSMTARYEATSGEYFTAWINHGIKPHNGHYRYVVFPRDAGGEKADELLKDPPAFFRVISDSAGLHAVHFPKHELTACAFYDPEVPVPPSILIGATSHSITALYRTEGAALSLAVSVPDLGWEVPSPYNTLSHASKPAQQFAESKNHQVRLVLRGEWDVYGQGPFRISRVENGLTYLTVECRDGKSRQGDFLMKNP